MAPNRKRPSRPSKKHPRKKPASSPSLKPSTLPPHLGVGSGLPWDGNEASFHSDFGFPDGLREIPESVLTPEDDFDLAPVRRDVVARLGKAITEGRPIVPEDLEDLQDFFPSPLPRDEADAFLAVLELAVELPAERLTMGTPEDVLKAAAYFALHHGYPERALTWAKALVEAADPEEELLGIIIVLEALTHLGDFEGLSTYEAELRRRSLVPWICIEVAEHFLALAGPQSAEAGQSATTLSEEQRRQLARWAVRWYNIGLSLEQGTDNRLEYDRLLRRRQHVRHDLGLPMDGYDEEAFERFGPLKTSEELDEEVRHLIGDQEH